MRGRRRLRNGEETGTIGGKGDKVSECVCKGGKGRQEGIRKEREGAEGRRGDGKAAWSGEGVR